MIACPLPAKDLEQMPEDDSVRLELRAGADHDAASGEIRGISVWKSAQSCGPS